MKVLLDSHVLVWFVIGDRQCEPTVREMIADPNTNVFVSAASAWEVATKARLGKWSDGLQIMRDLDRIMADNDFTAMPVSLEHGRIAGLFESDHKDPFDRMLAAQSRVEAMPLITADRQLVTFGIETIW